MAEKKYRFALITRYQKLCVSKESENILNIYAEQWAADALIDSYGLDTCYEMLEYYFRVSETPSWKWFINNADKVYKNVQAKKEDDRIRSVLKEQAKDWLK